MFKKIFEVVLCKRKLDRMNLSKANMPGLSTHMCRLRSLGTAAMSKSISDSSNEQKHQCLLGAEEAEMGKEVRLQKGQEEPFGATGHIHQVDL